jgi:protein phosphatase
MGCTVDAIYFNQGRFFIGHVGDSRAYRVRGDAVDQLTIDHSKVADMVRARMLTPEQAATHPMRSVLTRAVGQEPALNVDIARSDLQRGDLFVLCSDGLWDVVGLADLAAVGGASAAERYPTPREIADELVERALQRGSSDNVTCAVVRVTSDRPIPAATARRPFLFRRGR